MSSVVAHIPPPSEGRRQQRTHLFVAATLYAGSGSSPVHIRNMSPSGALIEASVLPDVGSRVALKRGQLHAIGRIAWQAERRAGVCFDAAVFVSDWMARQGSTGQAQVDEMMTTLRANRTAEPQAEAGRASIEGELSQLRSEIAAMGGSLIADPILVATHPEIQTIDIALQRIDRIVKLLHSEG